MWHWRKNIDLQIIDENWESRDKPSHLPSNNFSQFRAGKSIVFSTNGVGKTGYPHAKGWHWTTHHLQKWKWIKDLNIGTETIKHSEENIEVNVMLNETGVSWLWHQKHKEQKRKINGAASKFKASVLRRTSSSRCRQPAGQEEVFPSHICIW